MRQRSVVLMHLAGWFAVCIALAIVLLSLLPSNRLGDMTYKIPYADKGAHALAYAVFGFWMFIAVSARTARWLGLAGSLLVPLACVLASTLVLGYAIELIQPLFGRQYEVLDLLFDLGGGFTGSLAGWCSLKILAMRLRNVPGDGKTQSGGT